MGDILGKVTLEMIANELSTSKNTVSKALRGLPGVSEELRQKIIKFAEDAGYIKSTVNLTNNDMPVHITLVCRKSFFSEPSFWSQVFYGIWDFSGHNNISIRTVTIDMDNEDSLLVASASISNPCDGYVIVGTISDELIQKISETSLPMVVVDNYYNDIECDYINTANGRGIYKAVKHLYLNNHKNIGFINNTEGAYSFTQRYEAFLKHMELFRLTVDSRFIWHDAVYIDTQYYVEKIKALRSLPNFPTAWVCVNDNTALAFFNALKELKIKVPDDISIIGFDNISGIFAPFLTTIDVPQKAIGWRALEQLIHRIKNPGEPYVSIQINTSLVERSSVKRLSTSLASVK